MRALSLLAVALAFSGCVWITPAEQEDRYDLDGDGILWPDDCDDADEAVTGPGAWYVDADGDGFGIGLPVEACVAPEGHVAQAGDCDDAAADVNPEGSETCDGRDEDCDQQTDEDAGGGTWYEDVDGDGFGDPGAPVTACEQPSGAVDDATDCDDAAADVYPGAPERCDDADVDEDCDGLAEDGDADSTGQGSFYADVDGDGYGDAAAPTSACDAPSDHVADATDCDDTDAGANPGAAEVCDTAFVDEDCDGLVNEDDPDATGTVTWYADADGDGFGDADVTADACERPVSYVGDATDCDDTRDTVYPGAAEYCDGVDTDCDGTIDEDDALDAPTYHADADGDGYGDAGAPVVQCDVEAGVVDDATDCDDASAAIHPGATEVWYDGTDQDCDGGDDYDQDGDGFASDLYGGTDCDDTDPAVVPGRSLAVPSSVATIQGAIDLACAGDVIDVAAGTYAEALDYGGKDVTVRGAGATTVIDGGGAARPVTMDAGTLEAVTLTGGAAFDGGCLHASGAATVRDVTITGCTAFGDGGGAFVDGATVEDVVVDGCAADFGDGGGVYATSGTLTGLWIEGNQASGCGGLALAPAGALDVAVADVVDNAATLVSGICVVGDGTTLSNVEIRGGSGGGAGLRAQGAVTLDGVLVAGAPGDGIALEPTSGAKSYATNVTAVGNGGDGIEVNPTKVNQIYVTNAMLAGNAGSGLRNASTTRTPIVAYTDAWDNATGAYSGIADPTGTSGNVAVDPSFVSYAPALDPLVWDLHLGAGSAVRDAGDPSILDGDGSRSDIGAYGGASADATWYADADGDGLYDGWETDHGLDPSTADASGNPDADGLTNAQELAAGTDPAAPDTDGDGAADGTDTAPIDPSTP